MRAKARGVPPLPDIHQTARQITRATERLRSDDPGIPQDAAHAILEFAEARSAAVSPSRRLAYLDKLRAVAGQLGNEFLVPTRETPAHFLRVYRDAETWTKLTVRSVLMSFWSWRFEQQGKEIPAWLRIPISKRSVNGKDHNDVLSNEEVARLADAALNPRDKALIWTLYESGARVGELLALRLGDVERMEYGAIRLRFPSGKTGQRTVPLFEAAVPNLLVWLKEHPRSTDPGAPLWCAIEQPTEIGKPIGYRMVVKLLESAARRAGVAKPVNPHNFRHSRATEVAQNPQVSTSVLEQFFGWQPGSPMARVYVHLSGKEVEEALARAHGIDVGKSETPKARLPLVCARCGTSNDPAASFCLRCGGPLSLEGVAEADRWKREEDQLAELLSDPKVLAFLARRLESRSHVSR